MDDDATSNTDSSATMVHRTTGLNVKGSELINSGRDTNYNVQNNYVIGVFSEIIGFIQFVAPYFIAWTRHRTDGKDRDPVEISDIIPPDPFLLPVSNVADRYTRSMLECLIGYPLYEPDPFSQLSKEYLRNGINVGDVGYIRQDGAFDFLFNICPPQNGLLNPSDLPGGFSLEKTEHSETRTIKPLPRATRHFPPSVTRMRSGEYICEKSEGAILELPEGAIQAEAVNRGQFEDLAKLHGVEWYKYTINRGRSISNGSLYLVTSYTKCTQWGIAVFDRRCDPGNGLTFVDSPLGWQSPGGFTTKVADTNQGDTPNQCVFLQGYKIMIRQEIFDDLRTRQRAQRIRGGGGSDFLSKLLSAGNPLTRNTASSAQKSEKVLLHADFNSSPVHPSDLINATILSQNPGVKIALTHDNVWCDLLQENFPESNYATLKNVARSYMCMIDEYGCASLKKVSDLTNALDKCSRPVQGTETLTELPSLGVGRIPRESLSEASLLAKAFEVYRAASQGKKSQEYPPVSSGTTIENRPLPSYQNLPMKYPRTLARPPFTDIPRSTITAVAPELENVPTEYILRGLRSKAQAMISGNAAVAASLPKSLHRKSLSSTITAPIRVSSADEYPTHVLAMSSLLSISDQIRLFPIHSLVLASQCALLPRLPASRTKLSSSQITLQVLPISVPSPAAFPILHQFMYNHRLDSVLKALFPLPPDFLHSISYQRIRTTLTSEAALHRLSDHLWSSASSNIQALMEHATHVKELWQDMAALGLYNQELWDTVDLAWGIVLGALDLATGGGQETNPQLHQIVRTLPNIERLKIVASK